MKTKTSFTKILSLLLVVSMIFGGLGLPVSASSPYDDGFSYGGDTVIFPDFPEDDTTSPTGNSNSGSSSEDIIVIGGKDDKSVDPLSEDSLSDLQTEQKQAEQPQGEVPLGSSGELLPWARNLHDIAESPSLRSVSGIGTTKVYWSGGNITFGGGTYWVGSGYLYKITYSDGVAFCAEFNGNQAGGKYEPIGEGSNAKIKQILANFDKSGQSETDYITAQCLIWAELLGTNVNWGGFSPSSAIVSGSQDTSKLKYVNHKNTSSPHTQNVLTYTNTEPTNPPVDPPPEEEEYEITVIKRATGTNELLAGATFVVRHVSHGVIGTFTTDGSGKFTVKVPWAGTYIVTEVAVPDGYVMPDDPDTDLYVDINNPKAEFTFYNEPYTGIEVTKVDAHTGQRLAGATIKLTEISTGISYTKVTDAGGIARFTDLRPNDYSVQEIVAPTGYKLNNTVYPISLESNKLASVTIEDERLSGLIIKKVDPDGKAIAGAVFELRTGGGTVITRETTDTNGVIFRGNLPTDTYVAEEIQAPTGYVLDPNNPQSIYIDTSDPNKEFTLTFVNQKKPALEILKVDKENSSKVLFGATFRIAEQGGSKTWDITTDRNGTARLENLDPNITYVVEEIVAPSGYLNSGYKEAIVLEVGKTHKIVVENEKLPELTIKKIDEETGRSLAGAVFRIAYDNGAAYMDVTTGSYGTAVVPGLPVGWVTIVEIKSPNGYLLNSEPIQKHLEAGSDNTVIIKNLAVPYIKIVKIDSQTGERLMDAVFRITEKTAAGDTLVGEFTTDNNGEILLPVTTSRYYIEEIKAPNGYLIDTQGKEVTITSGTLVVPFTNTEKPQIKIVKVDDLTDTPLAGAVFKIVQKNDNGDVLIGEYTSDENGEIILEVIPARYYIEEIKAPNGFLIDTQSKEVTVEAGKTTEVKFTNTAESPIYIAKVDPSGKPLAGAKFKITKVTGEFVAEVTSSRTGYAIVPAEPGSYLVEEIKAPDGYIISTGSRIVELKPNGKPATVEFVNEKSPNFELLKLDEDTGKPIADVTFTIVGANGEKVGTGNGEFTTDHDGRIYLENIAIPVIVVTEVKSADGYILDNTPHTVQLKNGETVTLTLHNIKKPSFELLKLDESTSEPVMGAVFTITTLLGEKLGSNNGEFVTDRSGRIYLENIDTSVVIVTEIRAADGYILNSTAHTVQLKNGEASTLTVYNKAKAGLQIRKVDSVTLFPVAGAVFSVAKLENGAKRDLGTFTSGDNGLIYIPNLEECYLEISEIKAPEGYILDPTPKTVYIKSGILNTVEFTNQPYSELVIKKIDSESREPLQGALFRLYDEKRVEIGTFETSELGIIFAGQLTNEYVYLQEIKAPSGYILDSTVHKVELQAGKTVTVEVKNTKLGSLRIVKVDAETGKPLAGVTFLIYDAKNNIIGEFITDQNGVIELPATLEPQKIKIKEIRTIKGYVLNDEVLTVEIKSGETTEVRIENEPERGRIQILKKAGEENDVTKDKKGKTLAGAVFEIVNEDSKNGDAGEVVDTITTGSDGLATTKDLPLGKYKIREKEAPKHYLPLETEFYAEIKVHGDLVKFEVLNEPVVPEVSIEKRGNVETLTGDSIRYDFSNIENLSNVPLDNFYWRDILPTDAVRLEKIFTGTWNERLIYKVTYATNLKKAHRTFASGLHTNVNNELNVNSLKLAANEYVTEFRFEFGTVKPGFKEADAPFIFVKVNEELAHEYRFTNKADVGGQFGGEWVIDKDSWVTIVYKRKLTNLPKTGK